MSVAAVSPDNVTPPLSIRLFGPCEVRVSGDLLPRLSFRKSQSVFALLTLRHGTEVEREWLAGGGALSAPRSGRGPSARERPARPDARAGGGRQLCRGTPGVSGITPPDPPRDQRAARSGDAGVVPAAPDRGAGKGRRHPPA